LTCTNLFTCNFRHSGGSFKFFVIVSIIHPHPLSRTTIRLTHSGGSFKFFVLNENVESPFIIMEGATLKN
jgi:hypothetical protein